MWTGMQGKRIKKCAQIFMPDSIAYASCFKQIIQKKSPNQKKKISFNSVLNALSLHNHILLTKRYTFIPLNVFSYASSST